MDNVIKFPAWRPQASNVKPTLSRPSAIPVESLFESRAYALSRLHADMLAQECEPQHVWMRSDRSFRQRFCKIVREFSDLSQGELCELLNGHPRILALRKLPGAYRFYPVTTEFLADLENNIIKIIEYNPYGGGFLGIGAYGVPTAEIASVIADLCGATREYGRFEEWCQEYIRGSIKKTWP